MQCGDVTKTETDYPCQIFRIDCRDTLTMSIVCEYSTSQIIQSGLYIVHILYWFYIGNSFVISDDNLCFESAYKDTDIVTEDLLFGECSACMSGDCSGIDFQNLSKFDWHNDLLNSHLNP